MSEKNEINEKNEAKLGKTIDLSGKVALVTGASRGIGRAAALRLAESGADVVVNYSTSKSAAESVAAEIAALGRNAFVVKADVSEKEDVDAAVDFIATEIGRLDILISGAATGGFRPLLEATENNFRAAATTNVLATIRLVQAAIPLLRAAEGRGKIVALSSCGASKALPGYGLIGASKAALEAVVRHLTLEIGDRVNVNVVSAGLVDTDSGRKLPFAAEMFAAQAERSLVGGRPLRPEDVADTILFLASPLSDLVQGATLVVDGGAGIRA